jgi:uncharacterized protein
MSQTVSLAVKVAALRTPAAYLNQPAAIEVVETHFAWVFLTDQHVYKLKKPLCRQDLDLSTLIARRKNCNRELQLNRRLSPAIYLGVVPLTDDGDRRGLMVAGNGPVVDWLVWMKRLPSELMLDRAMAGGTLPRGSLHAVGELLAHFYRAQRPWVVQPHMYLDRIAKQMSADHLELASADLCLAPVALKGLASAQRAAFEVIRSQLAQRAQQSRIVDAHGDLRPEHVCLSDPPCIIDSLEFSDDLRILDAAEDLALLVVECAAAGNELTGEAVFAAYREAAEDRISTQLLDFYCSRRATVRAKLTAWHLRDPAYRHRERWVERAERYLQRATFYAGRIMQAM